MPALYSPHRLDVRTAERALLAWEEGFPRPVVDLSRLRQFDAYGVLLLILEGRRCQEAGGIVRFLLPEDEAMRQALAATGLFQFLAGAYWADRSIPRAGEGFLTLLARVRDEPEVKDLVDEFTDRLQDRFPLGEASIHILVTALLELLQNIPQHANPGGIDLDPFGLSALMEFPDHIHLAVVDKGVGIRGSLTLNPKFHGVDDAKALQAVLVDGASRFIHPGRGGALKRIREVVLHNGGKFYVRSGTGAFLQEGVEWDVGEVRPFPGVQVSIRLPRALFE